MVRREGHELEVRSLTALATRGAALAASLAAVLALGAGCRKQTDVDVYVDGFEPENVRFEVEQLGARTHQELTAISHRGDIDGLMLLPGGACGDPCRAVIVSIFVHNRGGAEAPPVVRLKVPNGKAARQPIAFRGGEISHGRVGRIRWVVELWPEEQKLTATLSSSVRLVEPPAADAGAAPAAPQESPAP